MGFFIRPRYNRTIQQFIQENTRLNNGWLEGRVYKSLFNSLKIAADSIKDDEKLGRLTRVFLQYEDEQAAAMRARGLKED